MPTTLLPPRLGKDRRQEDILEGAPLGQESSRNQTFNIVHCIMSTLANMGQTDASFLKTFYTLFGHKL